MFGTKITGICGKNAAIAGVVPVVIAGNK